MKSNRRVAAGEKRHRTASRSGFTIVELVGACMLVGLMFTITLPMVMVVTRERRSTEQRQFALQHLENLLERAVSVPDHKWDVGEQKLPDAEPDLLAILPGLERSLIVKPVENEPSAQVVVASIRWTGADGRLGAPMQLTAWVYPPKGGDDANEAN